MAFLTSDIFGTYKELYYVRKNKGEVVMSEFDKIIGYENEKTELIRLCNVISNREKYLSFGIKIPQALLIYG